MQESYLLLLTLILLPLNVYSQAGCEVGQISGCGSFNYEGVPTTICGCFGRIQTPNDNAITLNSCSSECAYDGLRTDEGCQCLRGPVDIPDLLQSSLPNSELSALFNLKLKDPSLYQVYIDTQLGGDHIQVPMPVKEFTEALK